MYHCSLCLCLISIDGTCKHLWVSSDTVSRGIDRFSTSAHRMGRRWKFKRDQIDAWVEADGAANRNKKDADE